ncbi:MAG: CDGSH iron-sulfur domain-containing protein [Pelagibacterales bacterium]|jgi:CDGSH iron-sulfur domain-containing protein 3|nr:CDGSH iron-sulfur domain-containing protein [Pelagibacterales bacterium]
MKEIELQKDKKYSICSCGLSKTLPFCDHAHREYNEKNGTNYKSVKIIADETVTVNMDSSTWNIK